MKTLVVNLDPSYTIYLDQGLLNTSLLAELYGHLATNFVIITDERLAPTLGAVLQATLAQQQLACSLVSFPADEQHKTRETKQRLEDQLLQNRCGRDTCIIALGGGVVTDMAGFIAATYCRGIPIIYIPTTLLAMIDASIGGKTAVNTPYGKNLIGTFSQPQAVFIDPDTLNTLPDKEWKNGLAEIIKHALIADVKLCQQLRNHPSRLRESPSFLMDVILTNCAIKKHIVELDEKESGIRQLLNFGHTIGHAIEILENYQIAHGEAVAIGILVESYLSMQCGFLAPEALQEIITLVELYKLPLITKAFADANAFKQALILDKKTLAHQAHFVLLDAIGKPHREGEKYSFGVSITLLEDAIGWADKKFNE